MPYLLLFSNLTNIQHCQGEDDKVEQENLDQDDQTLESREVTGPKEKQVEEKAGFKVRYTPLPSHEAYCDTCHTCYYLVI